MLTWACSLDCCLSLQGHGCRLDLVVRLSRVPVAVAVAVGRLVARANRLRFRLDGLFLSDL